MPTQDADIRNATDAALRKGTARTGQRKATNAECADELRRRITNRRLTGAGLPPKGT